MAEMTRDEVIAWLEKEAAEVRFNADVADNAGLRVYAYKLARSAALLRADKDAERRAFETCAGIADSIDIDRPEMEDGPLKAEWNAGVSDASIAIADAIRAAAPKEEG